MGTPCVGSRDFTAKGSMISRRVDRQTTAIARPLCAVCSRALRAATIVMAVFPTWMLLSLTTIPSLGSISRPIKSTISSSI